ncbi:MAG TPA: cupin domain-containing protein [Nitrolancea sp.]|nr:cupin domain-containing protein [Nitrolancea sp.]
MSEKQLDENGIERLGGFSTVRAGAGGDRWSGADYAMGLSRTTVGSNSLSMNVARLPAGGSIEPHIHDGYEVGLYVLEGRLEHRFGPGLKQSLVNGPGDFIFVESGVPHAAHNLSDVDPVVVVVARTSADEWARVVPYDSDQERSTIRA